MFAAYLRMYEYDKGPLDARILETVDEGRLDAPAVRPNAAYPNDTLLTYLYLPKRGNTPFPVVAFWPGPVSFVTSLRGPGPQRSASC